MAVNELLESLHISDTEHQKYLQYSNKSATPDDENPALYGGGELTVGVIKARDLTAKDQKVFHPYVVVEYESVMV